VITLNRLSFTRTAKPTFINKVWKFLCHLLFNLGNGSFKALFCPMGDVEVKWRILVSLDDIAS
jgi:hypothetical protein